MIRYCVSSNMFYADIDSISNCFMLMRIILVSIKRGSLSHLYTADQKREEGVSGIRSNSEHTLSVSQAFYIEPASRRPRAIRR